MNISDSIIVLGSGLRPRRPGATSVPVGDGLVIRINGGIHVSTFNLGTQLANSLGIIRSGRKLNLGKRVGVPRKHFRTCNRSLVIHGNRLLFSNPPSRPCLGVRTVHGPSTARSSMVTKIHIANLTSRPGTRVFSSPTVSRRTTLSCLLHKRKLRDSRDSDTTVASVLVNLKITRDNRVINGVNRAFNMDGLTLSARKMNSSSRIIIDNCMLPNLRIGCNINVFSSVTALALHCHLVPGLCLRTISNMSRTLSLLCRFRF